MSKEFIPSTLRWRPDFKYVENKFIEVPLSNFTSHEPSVTDKEAYRLTLASLKGEIAQSAGGQLQGSYSLKPGEEYDPNFDFSFLNRKDLTIVELDEYIADFRMRLENDTNNLNKNIEKQLIKAEKMRQSLEKEQVDKNNEAE